MTLVGETPLWIELDGAVNARAVVPGALLRSEWLRQNGLEEGELKRLRDRLAPLFE